MELRGFYIARSSLHSILQSKINVQANVPLEVQEWRSHTNSIGKYSAEQKSDLTLNSQH